MKQLFEISTLLHIVDPTWAKYYWVSNISSTLSLVYYTKITGSLDHLIYAELHEFGDNAFWSSDNNDFQLSTKNIINI